MSDVSCTTGCRWRSLGEPLTVGTARSGEVEAAEAVTEAAIAEEDRPDVGAVEAAIAPYGLTNMARPPGRTLGSWWKTSRAA